MASGFTRRVKNKCRNINTDQSRRADDAEGINAFLEIWPLIWPDFHVKIQIAPRMVNRIQIADVMGNLPPAAKWVIFVRNRGLIN